VTILIVLSLLGFGVWHLIPASASVAIPQPTPTGVKKTDASLPAVSTPSGNETGIVRRVWLATDITSKINYAVSQYTVQSGDALFSIAAQFKIKPETLLWANSDVLQDNPDNLFPGQHLVIPPTDGVYYQWKAGDTLDSVASTFNAKVDDILNWPGNDIDLTNPTIKPDTYIMVPGGQRALVQWIVPQVARGPSGTAGLNGANCSGPIGSGAFIWPTQNHYLSGYDFSPTHLGIDIAAGLGAPIVAADSGVVVVAGYQPTSGYGNVIMIDHGNGYMTVYGHLSQINVSLCQGVTRGQLIGLAGDTGRATGPHLHFEVRLNGGFVDPWYVLPKP
jgi:murein DD-endopeptidase MepM/ murein hydrolase activator NlpD